MGVHLFADLQKGSDIKVRQEAVPEITNGEQHMPDEEETVNMAPETAKKLALRAKKE